MWLRSALWGLLVPLALLAPGAAESRPARMDNQQFADLSKRVVRAVEAGDLAELETLIDDEGADIDDRYFWSSPAAPMLSMALVYGRLEVAKFLLERGADVDRRDILGGSLAPNDHPKESYTPLIIAALVGNPEGVKLVLDHQADVDAAGDGGVTPLMVAAAFGNAAVARALVAAKADTESVADDLRYLSFFGRASKSGFKRARSPAVENLYRVRGATALWIAAAVGALDVVKLLLETGADRSAEASSEKVPGSAPDEKTFTAGRIAELNGHADIARLLGNAEAPGNPPDLRRMPPEELLRQLDEMMSKGDLPGLDAYLQAGMDPDREMRKGNQIITPLVMACTRGSGPMVKLLLEAKADPDAMMIEEWLIYKDKPDPKAQERPVPKMDREVVTDRRETFSPLMLAARSADCQGCVDFLIDAGADIKATNWQGLGALAVAASAGKTKIVSRLIAAGAPLEETVTRGQRGGCTVVGATPLWMAACEGSTETVRLLLEAGADPRARALCGEHPAAEKDETECTSLRIAELNGHGGVVARLKEEESWKSEEAASLSPDDILKGKLKPARVHRMIRETVEHKGGASLLAFLDAGLEVDALIFDGASLTPLLSLAVKNGRDDLVGILVERGAGLETMSLSDFDRFLEESVVDVWVRDGKVPGAKVTFSPLMFAILHDRQKIFDRLMLAGADANTPGRAGSTALMLAASRNRADMVRRLLAAGARLEEAVQNPTGGGDSSPHGATALWLAAAEGAAETVRLLLSAGANVSASGQCPDVNVRKGERECDVRRIAEIRNRKDVLAVIDEQAGKRAAAKP